MHMYINIHTYRIIFNINTHIHAYIHTCNIYVYIHYIHYIYINILPPISAHHSYIVATELVFRVGIPDRSAPGHGGMACEHCERSRLVQTHEAVTT